MPSLKYILFCFSLLLFNGCQNPPQVTHVLKSLNAENRAMCRDGGCPDLQVTFPVFSGDTVVAKKINLFITDWIRSTLFMGDDSSPTATEITQALDQYLLMAKDYQPELTHRNNYSGRLAADVTFSNHAMVTLKFTAQFNTAIDAKKSKTAYVSVDTSTGHLISLDDLVAQKEALTAILGQQTNALELFSSIGLVTVQKQYEYWQQNKSVGFNTYGLVVIDQSTSASQGKKFVQPIGQLPWNKILAYLNPKYFP